MTPDQALSHTRAALSKPRPALPPALPFLDAFMQQVIDPVILEAAQDGYSCARFDYALQTRFDHVDLEDVWCRLRTLGYNVKIPSCSGGDVTVNW